MADQSRQQYAGDTALRTRYKAGDYVLYRNADLATCKVDRSPL